MLQVAISGGFKKIFASFEVQSKVKVFLQTKNCSKISMCQSLPNKKTWKILKASNFFHNNCQSCHHHQEWTVNIMCKSQQACLRACLNFFISSGFPHSLTKSGIRILPTLLWQLSILRQNKKGFPFSFNFFSSEYAIYSTQLFAKLIRYR